MTNTAETDKQQYTLGHHLKIENEWWLPIRFVEQTTLHEDPRLGATYIVRESFVELRNSKGEVRFAPLTSEHLPAQRDPGPCRGIKPYFWHKGGFYGDETFGSTSDSEGDRDNPEPGGTGAQGEPNSGDGGGEPPSTHPGRGPSVGNGPVPQG